ncbi:MAG: DnaB-like helicase C-terminal domain-containing protein [bacterium]|nr:DnaB-like helicase C-terminal domain-containing protein [bacterium]
MKCRKCGVEIEDTNISGFCGYCAYQAYREKETTQIAPVETESITGIGDEEQVAAPVVGETGIYNEELEQTLIKGFIDDKYCLGKSLEDGFSADMLQSREAQQLCELIFDIYNKRIPNATVDPLVIKNLLKEKGFLSDRMDIFFKHVLRQTAPQYAQVKAYIDIIKKRVSMETLARINNRLNDYSEGRGTDVGKEMMDFTSEIMMDLRDMQKRSTRKKLNLIKGQMLQIAENIQNREQGGEVENLGFSLKPFYDLNASLSGLRKGFFYGIAGAPRRGKTSFALELATLVAGNENTPVLFFSWEQTRLNLTYRLLAKESKINPDTLQRKRIMNDESTEELFKIGWKRMEKYMDDFYLIEGSKMDTVDRLKAHAYNIMQAHDTDDIAIFLDYIQKMPLSKEYGSEKFRIEEISTSLKGLTIELNCPILAISALTKEGCNEDTEISETRPMVYHCKGSGDIEYDLDCAMIMAKDWDDSRELAQQLQHKAEAMGKDPIHIPKIDIINVHIDKNRDAPEGISSMVQYFFFIEQNKFMELGYKMEADHYRFTKIENLIMKLMEEGYIVFRDIIPDIPEADGAGQRKIRLKF